MSARLPAPPAVLDPNQRYSLVESAAALRVSMPTLYRKMADKQIDVIHDGGRTYIHGSVLIRHSAPKSAAA